MSDEIPLELTLQIGRYVFLFLPLGLLVRIVQLYRPISQIAGEIRGTLERAKYMLSIAESSLADVSLQDTDNPGFRRFIRRTPLGVVLVIAPWK
jgi:acyl-CoA reductase-like NAD-dependent aldehyde dehydrogenase